QISVALIVVPASLCLAVIFFTFFLPRYRALRYLPSFPTRRSSDLGLLVAEGVLLGPLDGREIVSVGIKQLEDDGVINGHDQPAADRKSTRLNSSHDQISYAVFCLKKKKS